MLNHFKNYYTFGNSRLPFWAVCRICFSDLFSTSFLYPFPSPLKPFFHESNRLVVFVRPNTFVTQMKECTVTRHMIVGEVLFMKDRYRFSFLRWSQYVSLSSLEFYDGHFHPPKKSLWCTIPFLTIHCCGWNNCVTLSLLLVCIKKSQNTFSRMESECDYDSAETLHSVANVFVSSLTTTAVFSWYQHICAAKNGFQYCLSPVHSILSTIFEINSNKQWCSFD